MSSPSPTLGGVSAHGFLYTENEQKKLRKNLGRSPVEHPKGRGLCPFCHHMEARWASGPDPEDPSVVEVRVLCSQCQRRAVYRVTR